jgi:uncharacterized delta-60 repeat protein
LAAHGRSVEALEHRRLLAAGDLDMLYGARGTAVHGIEQVEHAAAAPGGRVVVVGASGDVSTIERRNGDGSADTSFGANGRASSPAFDSFIDAGVMADGRIVVLGLDLTVPSDPESFLTRFTSAGQLDASFGGAGVLNLQPAIGTAGSVSDLAVQSDGGIVFHNRDDRSLYRVTPAGAVDPTFGGGAGRVALGTSFEFDNGATALGSNRMTSSS